MKRILTIILLAMAMATVSPLLDAVVGTNLTSVYAVDAKTKAAKEREKAKAQKAKEREKAAAARKKAMAKKAKEAEKRKAAQQKAQAKRSSASKSASKSSAKSQSAPQLSAAEEKAQYMSQVEAINKSNAKAEAYNTRDIAHRLGFWGQVGYSNLFTKGIQYDATAGTGFQNKDKGFVGGGLGLGYQLRYKQFLFTTGAEFQTYNSVMQAANQSNGNLVRTYGMKPYEDKMTYTYTFAPMNDQLIGGFVQLPVMAGMEFKNIPLFWQAGLKVGMGVFGTSTIGGKLTTSITDKELIDPMTDMSKHTLVSNQSLSQPSSKLSWGLNLAATAEVGVNLDQWIASKARVRASLFVDYGFLNIAKYSAADGAQDIPAQLMVNSNPLDFSTNSALATTSATDAQVNPFLVGAKIAVWFDLPRKEKAMRDLPKAPTPRMGVYMYDAQTEKALGGVSVDITSVETGKKLAKSTNRQGLLQGRFAAGKYIISASKNGYISSDTVEQNVELFSFDTLRLALTPVPEPVLPTLCLNIYDSETKSTMEASVRFTTLTDTTILFAAQSSDDGFIETPLHEGDYIAHLTQTGYMSKDDTLHFVQDTLSVMLDPIHEGIKVKIENLFFATNKTIILPQSEQAMSDLAQFLMDNPTVTIHITGHTDAVGSDRDNQILSEGRANAVRNDLIKRGVAAERLSAEGKGESEPVADNDTEEGRQKNRRVEFVITGTDGKDIQQVY